MEGKRIVFTKPCVAELLKYELNDPADNEVQVRLAVSSVSSGTERGTCNCFPAWLRRQMNHKRKIAARQESTS